MISLVSLDEAKAHLHIDDSDHDFDISLKIAAASEILMSRLKYAEVPDSWIVNSSPVVYDIPAKYKEYAKLILSELNENREASIFNIQTILALLDDDRYPTLA